MKCHFGEIGEFHDSLPRVLTNMLNLPEKGLFLVVLYLPSLPPSHPISKS